MAKKRTGKQQPQKHKKVKHPIDAAVAGARAVAGVAQAAELAPGKEPDCVARLRDEDPQVREGALGDVTNLILVPTQARVLLAFGVPTIVAQLLCNDPSPPVRSAAAIALRNIVLAADDGELDAIYPNASFDLVTGLVRCIAASMDAVNELVANPPPPEVHAAPADAGETHDEDEDASPAATIKEVYDAALAGAYKDVDEFLQLTTVLAESVDAAAQALSLPATGFLPTLLTCLQCAADVAVQQSASECLKVLAEDSEPVAVFLDSGATAETKSALNTIITTVPSSPSLLRVAANVCGALLTVAPSSANVATVMPVFAAALASSPLETVQRLAPLLSADCTLDTQVRQMGVTQHLDRLRAMQAALQGLTEALAIVCDEHDDELEDEAAFAANPSSHLFTTVLQPLVHRAGEVLVPLSDPVLIAVLEQPSENGDITTLQRVMASLEVGVLGLTSSFMMLLPLDSFGGSATSMWSLICNAIASRHDKLNDAVRMAKALSTRESNAPDAVAADAASVASSTTLLCIPLQLESLTEMAATFQRKDVAGAATPAVAQLDIFTRVAWNPRCSAATRSHVVAVLNRIATKLKTASAVYSVGNFFVRVLTHAVDGIKRASSPSAADPDLIDVAAEVLDAVMDVFCEEEYDLNCYVALDIDGQIRAFLPLFKQYLQNVKGATKKGSTAWLRKRHLDEVASNTARFLQYKRENCPAVARR